jgi:hypothetical protein
MMTTAACNAELWRNRIFDWFERMSSEDGQLQFACDPSFLYLPAELIFQSSDWNLTEETSKQVLDEVCSPEELHALESLPAAIDAAWQAIKDDRPSIEAVQILPPWIHLREVVRGIADVFTLRERSLEAVDWTAQKFGSK